MNTAKWWLAGARPALAECQMAHYLQQGPRLIKKYANSIKAKGVDKDIPPSVTRIRSWREIKYKAFSGEPWWKWHFTDTSSEVQHLAVHTGNSKGEAPDDCPDNAIWMRQCHWIYKDVSIFLILRPLLTTAPFMNERNVGMNSSAGVEKALRRAIKHTLAHQTVRSQFPEKCQEVAEFKARDDSPRPLSRNGCRLVGSRWAGHWMPMRKTHPELDRRRSGRVARHSRQQ